MSTFLRGGDLPLLDIARGKVRNASIRNIFGTTQATANIVTTEFRTPWEEASDYTFPTSAATLSLKSTSTSDTAVTVLIQGLDSAYAPISETQTLTGTAPIVTDNSYLRVNDIVILTGNAVGTVTLGNGVNNFATILPGTGRCQKAVYTVPAGFTFFLQRIDAFCTDANGGKAARFRNYVGSDTGRLLRVADTTFQNNMNIVRVSPFVYTEKTDIKLQLRSLSGSTFGSVFAEGVLLKENEFNEWSTGY